MAALTSSQKEQLSTKLKDRVVVQVLTEWDPNLTCTVGNVSMVFYAADRSITVGDTTLDGANYKGSGFVNRMIADALEQVHAEVPPPPEPEPVVEAVEPEPIERVPPPPPPTSCSPITIVRTRPPRKPCRVERDGVVFTTKS